MSLPGIVVDAVVVWDAVLFQHNHNDWMICLFVVQKFGKSDPDGKNKRLLICILFKNTSKKFLCRIFA